MPKGKHVNIRVPNGYARQRKSIIRRLRIGRPPETVVNLNIAQKSRNEEHEQKQGTARKGLAESTSP
jgi:hypothetical protein